MPEWEEAQVIVIYTIGEKSYIRQPWPEVLIVAAGAWARKFMNRERGGFRLTFENADAFYLEYETRGYPDHGQHLLGLIYGGYEPRPDLFPPSS